MPVELAVIVPTFNEQPNIQPLLGRLAETLQGIDYEVIFVDDNSPDGTAARSGPSPNTIVACA
jgi:dolichol-phosphate mannosyltransferase